MLFGMTAALSSPLEGRGRRSEVKGRRSVAKGKPTPAPVSDLDAGDLPLSGVGAGVIAAQRTVAVVELISSLGPALLCQTDTAGSGVGVGQGRSGC